MDIAVMASNGELWERRAQRFLEGAGLHTIEQNFRARTGEIDLVMRDDSSVVFVEVRQRQRSRFATAAGSIDKRKQARIRRTAMLYLQTHPHLSNYTCRFDVVAWNVEDDKLTTPVWLRGAFV